MNKSSQSIFEKVYTEDGQLIVITRTSTRSYLNHYGFWLKDIDSHMDKRIIEYAQNGTHSYKEWDEFLKPLGYSSLWEQDFEISKESLDALRHSWVEKTEEYILERIEEYISERIKAAKEHYNDPVGGIEFHNIPKGKIFRIIVEDRDEYGEYVESYWPDEFIFA